jgi:hypothetical protein
VKKNTLAGLCVFAGAGQCSQQRTAQLDGFGDVVSIATPVAVLGRGVQDCCGDSCKSLPGFYFSSVDQQQFIRREKSPNSHEC